MKNPNFEQLKLCKEGWWWTTNCKKYRMCRVTAVQKFRAAILIHLSMLLATTVVFSRIFIEIYPTVTVRYPTINVKYYSTQLF